MQYERDKIIAEYHAAVGAYKEAVAHLNGLSGAAFEQQRMTAEKCREACEEIRTRLDKLNPPREEGRDPDIAARAARAPLDPN